MKHEKETSHLKHNELVNGRILGPHVKYERDMFLCIVCL